MYNITIGSAPPAEVTDGGSAMRRYAFCDFLNSRINRLDKTYETDSVNGAVSHCRMMQLAFQEDLDTVICAPDRLEKLYHSLSTQINYKWALQLYEEFFRNDPIACETSDPAPLTRGADREIFHIRYDASVPSEAQIPGLCAHLESAYVWLLDFAKEIFGNLLEDEDYRYIPVVLSPECPPDKIYPVREKHLRELEKKLEKGETLTDSQRNILEEKGVRTPILGEFFWEKVPRITIYFNAAADCATFGEYISIMTNCLAHEYMHYLHSRRCLSYGMFCFFDNDALSESMADFFGMLYSLRRKTTEDFRLAQKRYFLWNDLLDAGWPYGYAKCFFTVDRKDLPFCADLQEYYRHGSIQKLQKVLEDCPDLSSAYSRMRSGCPCTDK